MRPSTLAVIFYVTLSLGLGRAEATTRAQDRILRAIKIVETGHGSGVGAVGDHGAALGPYQCHRGAWIDSRVPGEYRQCSGLAYSRRVLEAYCIRYEPAAWARGDAATVGHLWNSGPGWRRHPEASAGYVRKVLAAMKGDH